MRILRRTESVGDLRAPDPRAVDWLETKRLRPFYCRPGKFVGFGIKQDVEWVDRTEEPVIIEPTEETLAVAAADFRDGFWVDVPYPALPESFWVTL